jgi:hypothetical protein
MTQTTGKDEMDMDIDTKPSLDAKEKDKEKEVMGVKPSYGFEGVPCLPPKWTYAVPEPVRSLFIHVYNGQITQGWISWYVKLTCTENRRRYTSWTDYETIFRFR